MVVSFKLTLNQISSHIAYLLLTCRKVEVARLGCFYASYVHAHYDGDYGIFYPSRIKIKFKSSLNKNSNLLVDSLTRQLKIKEKEALKLIDNFVDSVSLKLKKNHYCKLEGIGYLIENKEAIVLKDTFWKCNKYPSPTPMVV